MNLHFEEWMFGARFFVARLGLAYWNLFNKMESLEQSRKRVKKKSGKRGDAFHFHLLHDDCFLLLFGILNPDQITIHWEMILETSGNRQELQPRDTNPSEVFWLCKLIMIHIYPLVDYRHICISILPITSQIKPPISIPFLSQTSIPLQNHLNLLQPQTQLQTLSHLQTPQTLLLLLQNPRPQLQVLPLPKPNQNSLLLSQPTNPCLEENGN